MNRYFIRPGYGFYVGVNFARGPHDKAIEITDVEIDGCTVHGTIKGDLNHSLIFMREPELCIHTGSNAILIEEVKDD